MAKEKPLILVVDDEASILRYVSATLRKEGFEAVTAENGEEGIRKAEETNPALVILDIVMPKMDGFEVCRRLREWTTVPIIMLSARGSETDKVKCLNLGADDYITKPFGTDELIARVRAVLRRIESAAAPPAISTYVNGDLRIEYGRRLVILEEQEISLTATEYDLLQELAVNAGKVLTYAHLLQKIWGPEYAEEKVYVHEYIHRLRLKLESGQEKPRYIDAIRGVGYRMQSPETA